ncbi:hypothetical protein J0670_37720, partial [Streptomyces sp. FH025]|nr:hypothetical protein [Streptomyces sp. FH025]
MTITKSARAVVFAAAVAVLPLAAPAPASASVSAGEARWACASEDGRDYPGGGEDFEVRTHLCLGVTARGTLTPSLTTYCNSRSVDGSWSPAGCSVRGIGWRLTGPGGRVFEGAMPDDPGGTGFIDYAEDVPCLNGDWTYEIDTTHYAGVRYGGTSVRISYSRT